MISRMMLKIDTSMPMALAIPWRKSSMASAMAPSTLDSISTMKRMARPSASPSSSKKPSTCMQNILLKR